MQMLHAEEKNMAKKIKKEESDEILSKFLKSCREKILAEIKEEEYKQNLYESLRKKLFDSFTEEQEETYRLMEKVYGTKK